MNVISKRVIFIVALFFIYFGIIGIGFGQYFGANMDAPMQWFSLMGACLASYNIGAFFFGWTIFGGPGSVIGPDSDKFDRVGGVIVSAIAIIVFMYFWFDTLP